MRSIVRTCKPAALLHLFVSVSVSVLAQQPDHSLRIGTFNAWMLPDQGILIAPLYVAGAPVCAVGELTPEPPLWCEVGNHPVYDSDQIDAGAKALARRIIDSGYDVIALNEVFDGSAQKTLLSELWDDYPARSAISTNGAARIRTAGSSSSASSRFSRSRPSTFTSSSSPSRTIRSSSSYSAATSGTS